MTKKRDVDPETNDPITKRRDTDRETNDPMAKNERPILFRLPDNAYI